MLDTLMLDQLDPEEARRPPIRPRFTRSLNVRGEEAGHRGDRHRHRAWA
ncbi:hypothetical protein SBD_0088 [Streptomyces bottropensis ATCC 25435]|uniref:Uncharacterized protein n=1 Tax=Streptomyces bottropensis ATCC 25435 TaxID=1054862 RepID=M3ELV5_9ACTN|nr:hypothetical protein SBD_0088 [Streptomyces bottropensis ATCC 25435]